MRHILKITECSAVSWQLFYCLHSTEIEKYTPVDIFVPKYKCITWENNCSYSVCLLHSADHRRDDHSASFLKGGPLILGARRLTFADAGAALARWMCCRGSGTCLCRTLCRTERIRMKYWVHLWISGAERPLVGASACIFSWWKPLDGSFLLAASLNSESQKCNASWHTKKDL